MILRILPGNTRDLPSLIKGPGRQLLDLAGLGGRTWRSWDEQLRELEEKRPKVAFARIRQLLAISFHPTDTRDHDQLAIIAHDTLDRLGFGGQPAVIALRTQRPHHQLRIVTTRAGLDGGLVSDSLIHYRARLVARAIEQAHALFQAPDTGHAGRPAHDTALARFDLAPSAGKGGAASLAREALA